MKRTTKLALLGLLGGAAAIACNAIGFDPQSKVVDSVRLFAVKADKPYAKPGDDVTLEVLMTDARKDKPRPLKLYWLPFACLNPPQDAYYLCFVPADAGVPGFKGQATIIPAGIDAGAADGGAGAGGAGLSSIPTGVDLGPFLPQGPTFTFHLPNDLIQPRQGTSPYGIAIVFNIACAGRVELAPRDPSGGPQQVPILCTDENGVQLQPKDYVIGISRVYSYADRTNTNPVIEKMMKEADVIDPVAGVTIDHCTTDKSTDCPDVKLDTRVSDASWEDNPNEVESGLKEQIWVDYYSDLLDFGSDARLLFDAKRGRPDDSTVKVKAPKTPGEGTIWAVVHDNRGGAAWMVVPLHVK